MCSHFYHKYFQVSHSYITTVRHHTKHWFNSPKTARRFIDAISTGTDRTEQATKLNETDNEKNKPRISGWIYLRKTTILMATKSWRKFRTQISIDDAETIEDLCCFQATRDDDSVTAHKVLLF